MTDCCWAVADCCWAMAACCRAVADVAAFAASPYAAARRVVGRATPATERDVNGKPMMAWDSPTMVNRSGASVGVRLTHQAVCPATSPGRRTAVSLRRPPRKRRLAMLHAELDRLSAGRDHLERVLGRHAGLSNAEDVLGHAAQYRFGAGLQSEDRIDTTPGQRRPEDSARARRGWRSNHCDDLPSADTLSMRLSLIHISEPTRPY